MSEMKTYYGFLSTIAGNKKAVEQEKQLLEQKAYKIASQIRSKLTPATVPSLLQQLALRDIKRTSPLIGIPVTNAAGHGQYLRALCASVPFSTWEVSVDPKADQLLKLCENLWNVIFFREMIEELSLVGITKNERWLHNTVSITSLLEAVQGEIVYAEQIEDRINRIFEPFSTDIIQPSLGISTDDAVIGFRRIRQLLEQRLNLGQQITKSVKGIYEECCQLAKKGVTKRQLDNFLLNHPDYKSIGDGLLNFPKQIDQLLLFNKVDLKMELEGRATAFFEAFSFQPGQENLHFRLPHDTDFVRSRPFAKIGEDKFALEPVMNSG